MSEPCRCDAYKYPHRHGSGFCEAPEFVCTNPECRHGFSEDEAGQDEYGWWCPVCGAARPEDMTGMVKRQKNAALSSGESFKEVG